MNKLRPLFDRVVVEIIEQPTVTSSGLALPESVTKVNQNTGKVVATGPGRYVHGELRIQPMNVKVGDTVLFSLAGGLPFKLGDKSYLIFDESSILAVLEN